MVKCDRYDGVSGSKVLESVTWIGTAVVWTFSGGVPHSLGIMGESAAAEATDLLSCRSATNLLDLLRGIKSFAIERSATCRSNGSSHGQAARACTTWDHD